MSSLTDNVRLLHVTMETFANAKRFNERWLADPAFRNVLFRNPQQAITDYALSIDSEEARGIVTGDTEKAGSLARGIYAISTVKSTVMDQWYGPDSEATNPRVAAWRSRQQARIKLELGPFATKASVRAAWNAELTRGCSGGCWFCNMAAPELSGVAPSDDQALDEWREIIRMLKDRLGPATRTGFLDGASDPFDHPDYEAFSRVVCEEAGFVPPMSTALALRDPDRSRRFFAEAKAAGCWSVRLTIRDQEEFDAVHATFTSEELAHVHLNSYTPASSFVYSLAGRYRDRFLSDPTFAERERRKLMFAPWYTVSKDYREDTAYPLDANTGVVGFTLNMVERTVSLVTPRPSSDTFPLGLEVLDRCAFTDSDDLARCIDTLVERWMPTRLRDSDWVKFWTGLRCETIAGGVRLHGRFNQCTDITDPEHESLTGALAARLMEGTTVMELKRQAEFDSTASMSILHRFFDGGLLEEVGTA